MAMTLKKKIGLSVIVSIVLVLSSFIALAFFLDLHTYSFDEIVRTHSPNGKIDAVLVERGVGVGGANHYWIYLVPSSNTVDRYTRYFSFMPWQTAKTVGDVYNARKNNDKYGLDLRWQNNDVLEVNCSVAESHKLAKLVSVEGQNVNVIFHSGNSRR